MPVDRSIRTWCIAEKPSAAVEGLCLRYELRNRCGCNPFGKEWNCYMCLRYFVRNDRNVRTTELPQRRTAQR
jgi:hypothetical protein